MAIDWRGPGPWIAIAGAAACVALGWVLGGGPDPAAREDTAAARAGYAPRPSSQPSARPASPLPAPAASGPLITVTADGRVTLHVDRQPLQEVLDEIRRQADALALGAARLPAPAPRPAPAAAPPAAPADRLAKILRGDEPERHDGLLQALGAGGGVPEVVLKTLYETDGSPRVRLLAFEAALEAHAGDPEALHAALEAALLLPDAVVAQDARRRLDELDRTLQDTVPQDAPER